MTTEAVKNVYPKLPGDAEQQETKQLQSCSYDWSSNGRIRTMNIAGRNMEIPVSNDNPYALGGAVFGPDESRAWQVARQLIAGMIGVNKSTFGAAGTPWIGARESGYGFHGSIEGHRQFAQRRVISRNR